MISVAICREESLGHTDGENEVGLLPPRDNPRGPRPVLKPQPPVHKRKHIDEKMLRSVEADVRPPAPEQDSKNLFPFLSKKL